MITHARLKEVLGYNPNTGEFTYKVRRGKMMPGMVAGSLNHHGYIQIRLDRKLYYAHRLAFFYVEGSWPSDTVDHKRWRTDDNRFGQIRKATKSQNQWNRKGAQKNSTTGFLGVQRKPDGRFTAAIRKFGKVTHLGSFLTPEAAHAAYLAAKTEHHK